MSGIYGIYNANASGKTSASGKELNIDARLSLLSKWNLAYGDGQHYDVSFANIGMGICPEHITNAPVNKAPVLRRDNLIAVIDAVIYNRAELMSQYNVSATLSDEELLLECVSLHGYDILSGVNGDFCGAIYDSFANKLVLFRDHMGIRPLFFYRSPEWMGFSSDIRGLIALPDMPSDVNPDWLYRAVCGYDTADYSATEISDVYFVKPASYLVISEGASGLIYDEHVYWKLGSRKIRFRSNKAYCRHLRQIITDSVKRRLDVFPDTIGAELSGGLDSGVIDILINRLGRKGIYYSWSFSPDDLPLVPDDERQVIADICEQENIVCHYGKTSIDMGPTSNIGINHTNIGLTIDMNREPRYNYALPPYINTPIICETAELIQKSGGKVVFSGHGGDEGVSHRCDPFELYYHKEYVHFFKEIWNRNSGQTHRFIKTLKQCRYKAKRSEHYLTTPFVSYQNAPDILKSDFAKLYEGKPMPVLTFAFDSIAYIYSGNTHNRPDVAGLLGAYSGARYVFPYLDYRVIDYAVSIPRHMYLKGNQNRYIFRQAFKDIMPDSLYTCTAKDNPSTAGMENDDTGWFERFQTYREFLLDSINREYWKDYLDFDVLDEWRISPEPSTEERQHCINIAVKLSECLQYQNMVEVVKGNLL